jgi:hypothetical protein
MVVEVEEEALQGNDGFVVHGLVDDEPIVHGLGVFIFYIKI